MKKKYFPLVSIALLFLLVFLIGRSVPEETIKNAIDNSGVFAPVLYIVILLVTLVLAPLSGTPVVYAGFYAFGENVVIYSTIASYFSYVINFQLARVWGRPYLRKILNKKDMEKVDEITKNYGVVYLVILRIFQGGVHDFVSYAAGLTNMKFATYIITSILASIPGTALWYWLSTKTESPNVFLLITWLIVIVFTGVFFFGKFISNKRNK